MTQVRKKDKETFNHRDSVKHQMWCLDNNIKIYFKADNYQLGHIVVEEKNEPPLHGAHKYRIRKLRVKDERWWDVIYKLYTEYYNKYNN